MSVMTVERKYALTRVRAGDYIFPSNDAKTLWRIYSYMEDGSAYIMDGDEWRTLRGEFWAAAKFNKPLEVWERLDDPLGWEHWDLWHSTEKTRADAIRAALGRP